MESAQFDELTESGYCSSTSASASATVSILTTRHLLLDVLTEQFDENVKTSNYLESFGRSVPTMNPMNFCNVDDENLRSLNQLVDQMRQQTVVENGLLKELCGFFQEMCNIEPAPSNRKRTISTASSIEYGKESVRAVLKTITEPNMKLNEPKSKKVKTEIEVKKAANKISKERHDEYLACDLKVHDNKYLFKNMPKSPVCQYCLEPNDLTLCSGYCGGIYHSNCLKLIPTAKHYKSILMGKQLISKDLPIVGNESDNKCARCTNRPSFVCIFCGEEFIDSIQICDADDCLNVFHEKCFESRPQATKQGKQLCPTHNCRTCITQIDAQLMKCLLCAAKYHQSSSCIPAGCQLLSDNQMICVEHCTDVQNESKNNIKPLYGDFVWGKLG